MHPDPAFAWSDEATMRRFVAARGFAHLCVAVGDRPLVAHVPVVVTDDGALRFHIALANRVMPHLDGATAVASVPGPDFYVSPDWYGMADQVPTWNYVAVEIEGVVRRLDATALLDQIDRLSAVFEDRFAPKPAWTRAKLAPARIAAMCEGIAAFELSPSIWRGTAKLGQNKPAAARARVADALAAMGRAADADAMRPA
jgi:transcriptional regulator